MADSARARALRWSGRDEPLEAIEGFDLSYQHQRSRDIMSERPGRVHESSGVTRHAIEPRADPARQAELRFAHTVVRILEERFAGHEFERFVLVAGPSTLGDLRGALSAKLQSAILAELDKSLMHLPNAELKQHLANAAIL